jgi:hypothetical protein
MNLHVSTKLEAKKGRISFPRIIKVLFRTDLLLVFSQTEQIICAWLQTKKKGYEVIPCAGKMKERDSYE